MKLKYKGPVPIGVPALQRSLTGDPIRPGDIIDAPEKIAQSLAKDPAWELVKDSSITSQEPEKVEPVKPVAPPLHEVKEGEFYKKEKKGGKK